MSIYAIVVGNLTRDPEVRQVNTSHGPAKVCNLTVACSDRRLPRNADGSLHTEFIRVAAWNGLADICGQYLKKGRKVKVSGAYRLRNSTGNDREFHDIEFPNADDIEMLDRAEQSDVNAAAQMAQRPTAPAQPAAMPNYDAQPAASDQGFTQVEDDELPF